MHSSPSRKLIFVDDNFIASEFPDQQCFFIWPFLEAALPCAGFTANQALHGKLHIQPNQMILIHVVLVVWSIIPFLLVSLSGW